MISNNEIVNRWYADWCEKTGRNGGVLIGSSIRELLNSFAAKEIPQQSPTQSHEQEQKDYGQWSDESIKATLDLIPKEILEKYLSKL